MPRPAGVLLGVRPYLLLAGLCLLLYLPGIAAIPPLDRDEARFAQATRQMLETGDFLRIRFQDEARNKKPAGIYWLQAVAVSAFSTPEATAIWPYRVPSLLGGMAAVLLTFAFGAAMSSGDTDPQAARRIGAIAAVLLASALGVVAEAHIAKADAALLAAVMAGQGALGLAYVRARAGQPVPPWIAVVFWAGEIGAILLKGPPGPALAIVTIAALSIADRELRWLRGLRPAAGLVALIVAVAPWLIAIERATEGRFLADSLGHDLLLKLLGAQESHGAPPLSYLLLALATFWPGSLLLVPALVGAWRRQEMPATRFLLAWLVPSWILLELAPTKLPHYALPLYPALALLAAAALTDGIAQLPAWARRLDFVVRGLWLAAGLGLAALLVGLPLRFGGQMALTGMLGAGSLLVLAAALLRRPQPGATAVLMASLSLAFAMPAGHTVLPQLDRLWLSRAAADLMTRHPHAVGAPLVAVGYAEPSLVFLLGTKLRLAMPRDAAETLAAGGDALVSSRVDAMFREAVGARGLLVQPIGSVAGLDYSNGRRMVLTLYQVAPGRAGAGAGMIKGGQ
ncbi:MAG TPA: glycosyl transferase [Stellaceae bacterium]|jgi:4-amino-4-deoxy-L-arabinose transferase-like glycosyltransferase|nr:glycosyl transferase [Stellaceae bacterium]